MSDYTQKAINAAFYADPGLLRKLIDEGTFPKSLIDDTGILNTPFPIWRIPQCWEIAMGTDPAIYRDEIQGIVADFMERNAKVKALFAEVFSVEYTPVDFQQYHDYFFSEDPDDSDEDIIMEDNWAEIYKYGTRDIDIQLFCAVERFDFPEVKELLEKGADPNAPAYSDASGSAFSRIGDECSFLCTCELSWAWNTTKHYQVDWRLIGDLVGWAAHETMYRWIEKYTTIPENPMFESVYEYQEEMNEGSAKVYPIAGNGTDRELLVLDGSRAWFLELPSREQNLDNYSVCVSGYNKYFKALFSVETHQALAEAFSKEFCSKHAMDAFLERIRGRKAFKVKDYRLTRSSSELERYIRRCAKRRGNIPQEYFMYWYQEVAKHLVAAGLPEANVIDLLKKRPIQVGFIRAHGNGLTPEHLAKRLLEKPAAPEVYDVYAKPKVRVTRKMIAEYRRQLEQEYRKFLPNDVFDEGFIQHECYSVPDEEIACYLRQGLSPADAAYYSTL